MPVAKPGLSSSLIDRNPRETDEINVKPQVHSKFDKTVYNPGKYLDYRKEHSQMKDTS